MPPIEILPPELLIDIFVYCSWNDPLVPTALALVCTVWKDIVYTSPRVWQTISLFDDGGRSINSLIAQANRWINHSSPMQFDVNISLKGHTQEMILPLISSILPDLRRWRSCSFGQGHRKEVQNLTEIFHKSEGRELGGDIIWLDHIKISIHETWGIVDDDDDDDSDSDGRKWPSFSRHETGSVVLNVPVPHLPPPDLINPMALTSLTVAESFESIVLIPDPLSLLTFLTAFPQLESFAYNGSLPLREADTGDAEPPIVSLPRLTQLTLHTSCSVRMILSQLDVPMLDSLRLENLNVDFEFRHLPPPEAGDSEDEANDFSQSPSSDRALGIGMRRLYHRCQPPLKTLIMNYADFRTKDFSFCFKNFPLREFQIVGSDMSNKVIQMLKPYESQDGTLQVLLPEMVNLKLSSCNQLSGDSVVDALSSRVRYVDSTRGLPRMKNVKIVGCADVLPNHILALSQVLRSRFHASDK